MQKPQSVVLSIVTVELALLAMAVLWYVSAFMLYESGNTGSNFRDTVPMGWLVLLAIGPAFSALLGFVLNRGLKAANRSMRLWEILLVVFVTPQFIGVLLVWLMLLQ